MNYMVLVNKTNALDRNYIPNNLVDCLSKYKDDIMIEENVLKSFRKMQSDALSVGYQIDIMSGYRSYEYQQIIYNNIVKNKGFNYALRSIAKPGCSEHQTGLAIDYCIYRDDICYIEHDVCDLVECRWIFDNAHKYGFIVRYPEGKEEITGYNFEPWHLRYVGDLAIFLYNNELTLEEYFDKY